MSDRNYGDARILEFERLAADWESAKPDPNHPMNHLNHAQRWRKRASYFRACHASDPHWCAKAELPDLATTPARNTSQIGEG